MRSIPISHDPFGTHTKSALPQVLIIDDQPAMRRAIARLIPRSEYIITFAESAEEAMVFITQRSFDVVVSDLHMEGLSGMELLRHMRERAIETPVILITGAPNIESAVEAVQLGAFRYFRKPVYGEEFLVALTEAVEATTVTPDLVRTRDRKDELTERLRDVIDNLSVLHQPIEDLKGNCIGYESAMHSNHAVLAHPPRIVELAEQFHMLGELATRVRKLALKPLDTFDGFVVVDLHPAELENGRLARELSVMEHAQRVVMKLTQRDSLDFVADARARIDELRAYGFRIMVDRLGGGRASLASLANIQPELVKLDRTLVRDIDSSATHQRVVSSMVQMCRELNIQVVADGVATAAEQELLKSLGCKWFQGPLFGRAERLDGQAIMVA